MRDTFKYFVVLAGMRTGSNLLEEQLGAMPGVVSHGELFNPHFFGKPDCKTLWGMPMSTRDSDPIRVIGAMQNASDEIHGFRLFHDHSTRAIDHVLGDPFAAKIILTRRPIDSYVSLKIAQQTGQWWLGDMASARAAKVSFDAQDYADFLNELSEFQDKISHTLQTTGQTAFHITYNDLSDDDILAGLGRFLGAEGPPDPAKVKAKVQNPTPVLSRLTNPKVAEDALRRIAAPDLGRIQIYEPDRGPGLRYFHVCDTAPILYMPIRGAGHDPVPNWMNKVDPSHQTSSGMTQRELRKWKRQHVGHRSFSVLRHPLPRVHDTFCRNILPTDVENFSDVRAALISSYDVPLPTTWPDEGWTLEQHRSAFLSFLKFLRGNLGGQTTLRVDNTWATQTVLLGAIGQFAMPDRIVRERDLAKEVGQLCQDVGLATPQDIGRFDVDTPFALSDVATPDVEKAAAAAYRRDYVMFGFSDWSAG